MSVSMDLILFYCFLIAAAAVAVAFFGMRTSGVQAYAVQPAQPARRRLGAVLRDLHNEVATHGERFRSFGKLLRETSEENSESEQRSRLQQSLTAVKESNQEFVHNTRDKTGQIADDLRHFEELRSRLSRHIDDAEELGRMLALCDSAEQALREKATLLFTIENLQASKTTLQDLLITARMQLAEREDQCRDAEMRNNQDDLTRLSDRRAFLAQLNACHRQFIAAEKIYSCMLIDIDDLKTINDAYGRAAGDSILVVFARVLQEMFHQQNCPSRIQDDTFAVLLPGMDEASARRAAARLRERISTVTVRQQDREINFTASVGTATITPGESAEALLERTRNSLQSATQAGRNQNDQNEAEGQHSELIAALKGD